jgi:biotin transport system ATP-binding protein
MIELGHVTHRFGERIVLRDVSLTLAERRIGVVGANGSGKSTFARLLNGLLLPAEGRVSVDGLDTRTEGRAVRRRVGFVFQNPDHQIVYPTVEEDLAFGLKAQKLDAATIEARVATILARFDLAAFRKHPAHLLSGGQKQLLAIAGVLVTQPAHLVFDEPTTLLDRRNARRIGAVIDTLDQAAIVVSHDLDLLSGFERILVFDEGRLVEDDVPARALPAYVALMDAG